MTTISGRCLIIETVAISRSCLDLIGKSVANTIRFATSRVSDKQLLTHLAVYLVDGRAVQISPLWDIRSDNFMVESMSKISNLNAYRRDKAIWPSKELVRTQDPEDIMKNIVGLAVDVRQQAKRLANMKTFELIYVTGRELDVVTEDLVCAFVAQRMDYSFITQIDVLCICPKFNTKPELPTCCPISTTKQTADSEEFRSLLEPKVITESDGSIDAYFKSWIHQLSDSSEKIRIYLGSDPEANASSDRDVIKCDLREGLIDTNRVPIGEYGQRVNCCPIQSFASINGTKRCYEFKTKSLISSEGLSDALTFGIPYILSATHSPDLPYDQLESNYNRFQSLIEVMNEKKVFVLLESISKAIRIRCPKSFFVLMSSPDTNTLLMKAVATKELVLPQMGDSADELLRPLKAPKEMVELVRKSFNELPFNDFYSPLNVESNLYEFLEH